MTVTSGGSVEAARPRPGFRADIEGLRAVAILLVAVYHVWVGRVSGGVDVFLLISGFFVGASVVRSYAERRPPRLRDYYRRIFGRLIPPAALVLASVLVVTWFVLPHTRMAETARQGLASLLYYENWYLATSGQEYGAADVSQSMTQHFWSLSVQGQIFVALPVLFLLLSVVLGRRATRRVHLGAVLVLLVASFLYAIHLTRADQGLAYYSTFARAWEYLAGTVLAFVVVLGPVRRLPRSVRNVLATLGLGLVLATGVLVDGAASFPGPAALIPLLGAAALIVAGSATDSGAEGESADQVDRRPVVTRLLSSAPLVRAGGSAYGFYLWHWPVLVFVLALRDGRPLGWIAGTGVLVVSAALTWATELLLSTRTRTASSTTTQVAAAGDRSESRARRLPITRRGFVAALCVLTVVGGSASWLTYLAAERRAVVSAGSLDQAIYPGALASLNDAVWPVPAGIVPYPSSLVAQDDWPAKDRPGCAATSEESTIYTCIFGDASVEPRIALVGGSHAVNFLIPLDSVAQNRGLRVDTYFKQGCPVRFIPGNDSSCETWSRAVVAQLIADEVDAVVVTGTRPHAENGGDYVPESYTRVWDELVGAGISVVAIRDTPWLPFNGPECIEVFGAAGCTVARSQVLSEPNPLDVVAESMDLVHVIDLSDIFCDDSTCSAVIGNVQAYIDDNHLTETFSATLTSPLDERLGAVTGWW